MIETNKTDVYTKDLLPKLEKSDITEETMLESLEVLSEEYYIEKGREFGQINYFIVKDIGFENYAQQFINDYTKRCDDIIYLILNSHGKLNNETLPYDVVNEFIFENLENQGLIKFNRYFGGKVISYVSPRLRRIKY